MYVTITSVIPYTLGLQFQSVQVGGGLVVPLRVCLSITSAPNVSTNETDPEI